MIDRFSMLYAAMRRRGADRLDPTCMRVFALLLSVADDDGMIPKITAAMIAEEMDVKRGTVAMCRERLARSGLIERLDDGVFRLSGVDKCRHKDQVSINVDTSINLRNVSINVDTSNRNNIKIPTVTAPSKGVDKCRHRQSAPLMDSSSISPSKKERVPLDQTPASLPGITPAPKPVSPSRNDPPTAEEIEAHERFYREYPKQRDRELSLKAFVRRVRRGDHPEAIVTAGRFVRDTFDRVAKEMRLTAAERNLVLYGMKAPANYLADGGFKDQPVIPVHKVEGRRTAAEIRRRDDERKARAAEREANFNHHP